MLTCESAQPPLTHIHSHVDQGRCCGSAPDLCVVSENAPLPLASPAPGLLMGHARLSGDMPRPLVGAHRCPTDRLA